MEKAEILKMALETIDSKDERIKILQKEVDEKEDLYWSMKERYDDAVVEIAQLKERVKESSELLKDALYHLENGSSNISTEIAIKEFLTK